MRDRLRAVWAGAACVFLAAGAAAQEAAFLPEPANSVTNVEAGEGGPAKDPAPADAGKAGLEELAQKMETLSKQLTVITAIPDCKIVLGGAITADFLYNEARPVAPGTPFFLAPNSRLGFDQNTFDANARQTAMFALVTGPEVCGMQSGGFIYANLYNDAVIVDRYGLLPIQAFGQLKNEQWRFAAGLQIDIFNAPFPDVLPFSLLLASGNTGAYRGQLRIERYFQLSPDAKITVIGGISEPIPTTITNSFETIDLSEDNGWPNVETRVLLGLGPEKGVGPLAHQRFELAFSGVVGEIRSTRVATRAVVASVWGLGSDLRWELTARCGVKAEAFVGQTLGTYGGGILQDVNSITDQGLHAAGGFVEIYYDLCPEVLRAHVGYGIDDPLDGELAPLQPVRNETYFANLMWDVTKFFRVAGELTYRRTAYTVLPNNDGIGFQAQFQWKF